MDWNKACQMPAHGLSVNTIPLSTIVSMESGSKENRLCQALTKTLARGRLGLFLEARFHAPYLQILNPSSLSGSQNKDECVEQESLGRGGRINRSTHAGSDASNIILANPNPRSLWQPSADVPERWKCMGFLETSSSGFLLCAKKQDEALTGAHLLSDRCIIMVYSWDEVQRNS